MVVIRAASRTASPKRIARLDRRLDQIIAESRQRRDRSRAPRTRAVMAPVMATRHAADADPGSARWRRRLRHRRRRARRIGRWRFPRASVRSTANPRRRGPKPRPNPRLPPSLCASLRAGSRPGLRPARLARPARSRRGWHAQPACRSRSPAAGTGPVRPRAAPAHRSPRRSRRCISPTKTALPRCAATSPRSAAR